MNGYYLITLESWRLLLQHAEILLKNLVKASAKALLLMLAKIGRSKPTMGKKI